MAWTPYFPGADLFGIARYRDGRGRIVDMAVAAYGDQAEGREIVRYGIGATGPASRWTWGADGGTVDGGRAIWIVGPGDAARDVLIFYRIGAITTGSEARVKMETLKARLFGGSRSAVAILLSAEAPPGGSARPVPDAFLRAMGPVAPVAERATR